ncbi:Rab5-interacting protein [Cryptosporidium ubiquitum]|uniref:Rab5-interacting protein n=1 Tax=Cryptosporidium ubiquitum TaxID=857276 RepID=A0A1J4MK22_9CRYT|nr:Rab5-interacting protein [Cryptosporidium ubiquitum]OII74618.1 Rab5-interacting protein [Cryptosporidium ubiquitum]
MTTNRLKLVEKIRDIIRNNRNFSLFTKAINADTTFEWTKDEASLVTYWILQICAFLFGVVCGIFGFKGVTVLISAVLGLVFIGTTYLNLLDIPERILDPTEIIIENVATCLVTFILSWTTMYTLIYK